MRTISAAAFGAGLIASATPVLAAHCELRFEFRNALGQDVLVREVQRDFLKRHCPPPIAAANTEAGKAKKAKKKPAENRQDCAEFQTVTERHPKGKRAERVVEQGKASKVARTFQMLDGETIALRARYNFKKPGKKNRFQTAKRKARWSSFSERVRCVKRKDGKPAKLKVTIGL